MFWSKSKEKEIKLKKNFRDEIVKLGFRRWTKFIKTRQTQRLLRLWEGCLKSQSFLHTPTESHSFSFSTWQRSLSVFTGRWRVWHMELTFVCVQECLAYRRQSLGGFFNLFPRNLLSQMPSSRHKSLNCLVVVV